LAGGEDGRPAGAVTPGQRFAFPRLAVLATLVRGARRRLRRRAESADRFGKLDVASNNAGYGHFGMIEELTEDEVRAQLETNLVGACWVTGRGLRAERATDGRARGSDSAESSHVWGGPLILQLRQQRRVVRRLRALAKAPVDAAGLQSLGERRR
jgi:NAD(P)-dependent dehydrogenase (short-subunit alcohol dehydrogenase family)